MPQDAPIEDRVLVYSMIRLEGLERSIQYLRDGIAQLGDFQVPVYERMASEVLPELLGEHRALKAKCDSLRAKNGGMQ